jgi:hypothetical protein
MPGAVNAGHFHFLALEAGQFAHQQKADKEKWYQ